MIYLTILLGGVAVAYAGPATESYKDQFCTDPRTMKKHAAYTEWADAYSCTRHRCQPGGRNLAIYTVGCKRVEAPESAIECEEVVEDTNMQFPYCCTRLRCLVVVRGEVWTRVLGQPWETLPAAPWSHMYKMKKPPPGDASFLPSPAEGPVYELQTESDDKVLRAGKKGPTTEAGDCNEVAPRASQGNAAPDIVIALSTNPESKPNKKSDGGRHKRGRKTQSANQYLDDEQIEPRNEEPEESVTDKTMPQEPQSEERYYANAYGVTQKVPLKRWDANAQPLTRDSSVFPQPHAPVSKSGEIVAWTEIPLNQWNEHDPSLDTENQPRERERERVRVEHSTYHQPEFPAADAEKKDEKPGNLQALVDAIGTRMRDIESVVQRMSEKVQQAKPAAPEEQFVSAEKRLVMGLPDQETPPRKHHNSKEKKEGRMKKPNPDGEHYMRFSKHSSKYMHGADGSTEPPVFVEDSNLNGYFSDASNTMHRRANPPKEPAATYMAPVETRRKTTAHGTPTETSEEVEKKHKKHSHKKKKAKNSHHKKHRNKEDKRKRFNRINSVELDRNIVSLEDSSGTVQS